MRVEGMTAVEAVAYIKDWTQAPTHIPQNGNDDGKKLAFINAIWSSAGPLFGSIAERYLDQTRGIDLTKLPDDIHASLRFHPNCVFGRGTHLPCLLALMRDPLTDEPIGIQRIALEHRDGKIEKIERRMLGRAGVVKLWPAESTLTIGEGLETVLAAATRILYRNVPLRPAWAALSGQKLLTLPVLPGVERLIVLVDHDAAGIAAAAKCTEYWTRAGRTVIRLTPRRAGADFNDLVTEPAA